MQTDQKTYWAEYEFDAVTMTPNEALQHTLHDVYLAQLLKTRKGRMQLRAALDTEECVSDHMLSSAIQSCLTLHDQKQKLHMRTVRRRIAKRRREKAKRPLPDEKDDEDTFALMTGALSACEAADDEDTPPSKRKKRNGPNAQDLAMIGPPKLERQ